MVQFEGRIKEAGEREAALKRNREQESARGGSSGYMHIRTGVLDVRASRVLSIIEMPPYYILMLTE